jgi:predicted nuclease with TOPRIM domain
MEWDSDHANTASSNTKAAIQHPSRYMGEGAETAEREGRFLLEDAMAGARATMQATETMVKDRSDLFAKLIESKMETKDLSKQMNQLKHDKRKLRDQRDMLSMEKERLLRNAKKDAGKLRNLKNRLSRSEQRLSDAARNQTMRLQSQTLDDGYQTYEASWKEVEDELQSKRARRELHER